MKLCFLLSCISGAAGKKVIVEHSETWKVPIRLPGTGYCRDSADRESTARRIVQTTCAGAEKLCHRDCHCVAWACQPKKRIPSDVVLYTSTDCDRNCDSVAWILNPALITRAGHDEHNHHFSEGICFKWENYSFQNQDYEKEISPCSLPTVVGAVTSTMTCPRDSEGKVKHGHFCVWDEAPGFECGEVMSARCQNGAFERLPVCGAKRCVVPEVFGATVTGCLEGNLVENGTTCAWMEDSDFDCSEVGPRQCVLGNFVQLPVCAQKCKVPPVRGANSEECPEGTLVTNGTTCTWAVDDQFHRCYPAGLETTCVEGVLSAIPTCLPKCSLFPVTGAVSGGCEAGKLFDHGQKCSWSADPFFTCSNLGDAVCVDGAFVHPECSPKCRVPFVIGASAANCTSLQTVSTGTECNWIADDDHFCSNLGIHTCNSNGAFDSERPGCTAKCTVFDLEGATVSGCMPGAKVVPGTACTWEEKIGHSCRGMGTKVCSESGGLFLDAVPECDDKCTVPAVYGATSTTAACGAGRQVNHNASCSWQPLVTHTCINIGPASCSNGKFSLLPRCLQKCTVPALPGAIPKGCTEGGLVANGTSCEWEAKPDYHCSNMGAQLCMNGRFLLEPSCEKSCRVPVVFGARVQNCTEGETVSPRTECTWKAEAGYSCSMLGAPSKCMNGEFDAFPTCKLQCTVPDIEGVFVEEGCTAGGKVDHGSTCQFSPKPGFACSNSGMRFCSNGFFDSILSCAAECEVPRVLGASVTGCEAGAKVTSGTACLWAAKHGYSCSNVGKQKCEGGSFPAMPTCEVLDCYQECANRGGDCHVCGQSGCCRKGWLGDGPTCDFGLAGCDSYHCCLRGTSEGLAGKVVAFWSPVHKQFMKMSPGNVMKLVKSGKREDGTLPPDWTEARFQVIDAGVGLYAFYNHEHKAFIRMPSQSSGKELEKSPVREDGTLPKDWPLEAFKIIDVGTGLNAFWNPTWHKFMRMPDDSTSQFLEKSEERIDASLPEDWTWEQFKVIEIEDSVDPEDTLYATGDFKPNLNLSKANFDKMVLSAAADDGSVILHRECKDCTGVWKDIYLKLKSAKFFPSVYDSLLVTWPWDGQGSKLRGFKTDFNIYSTMADAKAGFSAWSFCEGGRKGIGFPGECGPSAAQRSQWNSLTLAESRASVRFSVYRDPALDGLYSWESSSWQHHPGHNCAERGASPAGDDEQEVSIDMCKTLCMETAECEGVVFSGAALGGHCWLRKDIELGKCGEGKDHDTWVQAKVKYFAFQHIVNRCVHPQSGNASPGNGVRLLYHDGCTGDGVLFRTLPVPGTSALEGYFVLQHKSGKCVHPAEGADSATNGEELMIWDGCSTGDTSLQFRVVHRNDGYFNLEHFSGKCVHPSSGSAEPGNNVKLVLHDGCEISNKLAVRMLPNFPAPSLGL